MLAVLVAVLAVAAVAGIAWLQWRLCAWKTAAPAPSKDAPLVGIIGSGFGGICCAVELRSRGIPFVIFEKSAEPGGTWRDNTYPGCGCDVPSFLYSFSFALCLGWTRKWAKQREIYNYVQAVLESFDLLRHVRVNTEITSAEFDAQRGVWKLTSQSGEPMPECRALICCVGQLSHPNVPNLPGREAFKGHHWHTARYNHDVSLAGKRVGVVGSGASAIQLVPELAKDESGLAKLYLFQRTPSFIMPKGDYEYPQWARSLFRAAPITAWLHRVYIYFQLESYWWLALKMDSFVNVNKPMSALMRKEMRAAVDEEHAALRDAIVPTYAVGCKRILISDEYLPALMRPCVEVVPERVASLTETGVVTQSGAAYDVDVLIYATGFCSHDFVHPMHVTVKSGGGAGDGAGGDGGDDARGRVVDLAVKWNGEPRAYLGMTVPGVPNFFMTYGPNTNLGHNSILFMLECQAHYIGECISKLHEKNVKQLEVKADVMEEYVKETDRRLEQTAFVKDCQSWYKTKAGKVVNNLPTSTIEYWLATRNVRDGDFEWSS